MLAGLHFQYPWMLLLIPLAALPVALLMALGASRREGRFTYPGFSRALSPQAPLPGTWRTTLYRLRPAWVFVIISLLCAGLARPRVPEKEVIIHREGVDIVVVFDISTSMRAADFKPRDRFTVAKETIAEFVKGRKNDRVGLVAFAGEAYTQVPLTSDMDILVNTLGSIRMGVIEDGTAIGNAVATAVNRLRDSDAKSKVVILLTDGDSNRGNIAPLEAANIAKEFGIRIHTVQVGRGGLVDYPVDAGPLGTMYQQVEIPVNPELLRNMADTTGGRAFIATDRDALQRIFALIDDMEKTPLPEPDFVLYRERFGDLVLPALVLLVLDLLLGATLLRRTTW